jgi:hypothetical protein
MVGGVAYGLASIVGGMLVGSLSLLTLLLLSTGWRLAAAFVALRLEHGTAPSVEPIEPAEP